MGGKIKQHRVLAVQRFTNGESTESICTSLGKSKVWLYKWIKRYSGEKTSWCEDRSRRPLSIPLHTPVEVEEIVKMVRLDLYNQGLFCGAQAIYWETEELGVRPLASIRTINRILSRNDDFIPGAGETNGRFHKVHPEACEPISFCPCYCRGRSCRDRPASHRSFRGKKLCKDHTGHYPGGPLFSRNDTSFKGAGFLSKKQSLQLPTSS